MPLATDSEVCGVMSYWYNFSCRRRKGRKEFSRVQENVVRNGDFTDGIY